MCHIFHDSDNAICSQAFYLPTTKPAFRAVQPGMRLAGAMRALTVLLGCGAAIRGVYADANDTFMPGGSERLNGTTPDGLQPWYAAAGAPAPLASFNATSELYDDDSSSQVCVKVEDATVEMAHIFSRKNIREQLDNVTVQPNAVIDDTAPATWRPLPPGTPLYAEGSGGLPRVSDIRQATRLGDCYFLGSLASLVAHHPQFIRDSLQEIPAAGMPDGVRAYRGRMFLRDSVTRTYRAVWVSADDQLPFDHLGRIGAFTYDFRNRSHTAAWPAIWEKLYAKLQQSYNVDWSVGMDGYASIGTGSLHQAMTTLTGQAATTRTLATSVTGPGQSSRLRQDDLDFLFGELADPKHLTQLAFGSFDTFKYITDDYGTSFYRPGYCDSLQMVIWKDGMNLTGTDFGLVLGSHDGRLLPLTTDHAYAVVGSDADNYYLFNPWGFSGFTPPDLLAAAAADAAADLPALAPSTANISVFGASVAAPPTVARTRGHRLQHGATLRINRREVHRLVKSAMLGRTPAEANERVQAGSPNLYPDAATAPTPGALST